MTEPDRPPGQRSLFDFGMRRVTEKQPPPEVDRAGRPRRGGQAAGAEQCEQDADAAAGRPGLAVPAAAAAPHQLVWVRIVCQPGAPAGGDIALNFGLSAPQPQPAPAHVSKHRARMAAETVFAL
jgi:hypothetical protein